MSWGCARYVFNLMDDGVKQWLHTNIVGGLSSWRGANTCPADYDQSEQDDGKKKTVPLPTQADKRVLVYESEFSSVLKMPARDGNTLE